MYDRTISFVRNTDGAVTVDWVVLAGAMVTLALLMAGDILGGASTSGTNANNRALSVVQNIKTSDF